MNSVELYDFRLTPFFSFQQNYGRLAVAGITALLSVNHVCEQTKSPRAARGKVTRSEEQPMS